MQIRLAFHEIPPFLRRARSRGALLRYSSDIDSLQIEVILLIFDAIISARRRIIAIGSRPITKCYRPSPDFSIRLRSVIRTTAVLEPDEVALVFGRPDPLLRQLVIRPGFAPMILQRVQLDKHEAFAGLRP
jgi:hypothetical protein